MNTSTVLFMALLGIGACTSLKATAQQKVSSGKNTSPLTKTMKEKWKARLDADTYHIMVNKGTEPPYQNAYWNNHEKGMYVSAATGEPLFSSAAKFDSHTGWPSFFQACDQSKVEIVEDDSYGEVRQEVVEKKTGLHLGHLFNDGPAPTGLRYCMNSGALKFIPATGKKAVR